MKTQTLGLLALVGVALAPAAQAHAASSQPAASQQVSVQETNRRIVAGAFDRWAAGGTGFFDEVLAPDVVWTIKGSGPSARAYRGRADFQERAVRPFATRMSVFVRPTVSRVWSDGDHVIARWDGSGVAGDGAPYRNSYVWILRMRDGRAVEVTAFLDLPAYDDVLRRVPASPVGKPSE